MSEPPILDPHSPLAFVPPDTANKIMVQLFAAVGSLSVLLWDILVHSPQEYTLLTKYGVNLYVVIYFLSRLSTLTYLVGIVITQTAPVGNCDLIQSISYVYLVAIPSSVLLLLLRVTALYNNNKFVIAFFSLSWLSVLATSILMPFGISGERLGDTSYCVETLDGSYAAIATVLLFVNNMLLYLATCWAFLRRSCSDALKSQPGLGVISKLLPPFSRSILRNGQSYFLITLLLQLVVLVLSYVSDPFAFAFTFSVPAIVLINNLSCHIYRNVRLGLYEDNSGLTFSVKRTVGRRTMPNEQKGGIEFKVTSTDQSSDDAESKDAGAEQEVVGGLGLDAVGEDNSERNEIEKVAV